MKKQSSIDILVNAIYKRFGIANCGDMEEEIQQAKELHKQEIIEATKYGNSFEQGDLICETYYKNTYEKES